MAGRPEWVKVKCKSEQIQRVGLGLCMGATYCSMHFLTKGQKGRSLDSVDPSTSFFHDRST